MIVYIDGEYLPHSEARISPLDRGFLHGFGAFETLRSYNGKIFMLDDHVKRLKGALHSLNIKPPRVIDNLQEILGRLLKLNKLRDARLRATVTAGHNEPAVLCTAGELPPHGEDLYRKGASAIFIDDPEKYHHGFLRIKSTSYLGNILIRDEARQRGALEAIICHPVHGPIECSMSNLFIVEEGRILTPPLFLPILPGITRDVVLKIAAGIDRPVVEITFTRDRLMQCGEVFITNSLMEVMPVTNVDKKIIGNGKPGKITLEILNRYHKAVTNDVRDSGE